MSQSQLNANMILEQTFVSDLMLGLLFKSLFRISDPDESKAAPIVPPQSSSQRLLNVGGNSKTIPIPGHYNGWQHDLLDIDPSCNPDVLCDARELMCLPAECYDAVYCSHNLEHYYPHDALEVLEGFLHILRPNGFAEIHVPDILTVMRECIERGLDLESVLYQSGMGPITVRDVLYGFGPEIERSGNDFFAHKNGFSETSLNALLTRCGFVAVTKAPANSEREISVVAFKTTPDAALKKMLGILGQEPGRSGH
jgi:SAM-dependent methyltransferase